MEPATTVEQAILESDIPPDSRIVVAVSGGPDSVALIDALAAAAPAHRWSLLIAHVNHGLRGEESDADARFVRRLARELRIPVRVRRVDTPALSRARRLSVETAARELRYTALREIARSWRGNVIATGHTMQDQAETVLLHLLRGAGLEGLAGIQPLDGDLARPFLSVRREAILAYLQRRRRGYRLDSSNLDPKHLRNRLRLEIIPELELLQPRAVEALARAAGILRLDSAFLQTESETALASAALGPEGDRNGLSRPLLRAMHPALQRSVVRSWLAGQGALTDISAAHVGNILRAINAAEPRPRDPMPLPGGFLVRVRDDVATVASGRQTAGESLVETRLTVPGITATPAGQVTATEITPNPDTLQRLLAVAGPLHAFCDAETLPLELVLRSRRVGDRLRLVGLGGSRKLQDIFVDHKVPERDRDRVAVVAAGDRIIWVPGFALDERWAASRDSRRLIHLVFRPVTGYPGGTIQRPF